jgi:hypothetical protein
MPLLSLKCRFSAAVMLYGLITSYGEPLSRINSFSGAESVTTPLGVELCSKLQNESRRDVYGVYVAIHCLGLAPYYLTKRS